MTFGVCCAPEEARAVLDAGFDYVELPASGLGGHEEVWDPAPYAGLPIPATNLFWDGRIRLFESEATPWREYAARTIERAASLGVEVMVIGGGGQRRAPEGFDGEAAFVAVAAEVQEMARPFGITIAPESLNRDETNVGTELFALSNRLSHAGVAFTADSYHILMEWDHNSQREAPDDLWQRELVYRPAHVHLGPLDRGMPDAEDDLLWGFADHLKSLRYDGRVSLEVNRGPDFDLPAANRAVRAIFAT